MKKGLLILFLLWCAFSSAAAAETYLVDGQVVEHSYSHVEYLENVDISIVEQRDRQVMQVTETLYEDTVRKLSSVIVEEPSLVNLKWYVEQYHLQSLALYESILPTVVAVIDTGVFLHEEMMPYVRDGYNVLNPENTPLDDHGHGTALASVMVDVIGQANVQLLPIKAADSRGSFKVSNIVKAIDVAIAEQVDIINLSFGAIKPDEMERKAIQKAREAGILVVSSSGNSGQRQFIYPAAYEEVISVSATDEQEQWPSFSTYNEEVDFTAPGYQIAIRKHFITDQLLFENGTSYSSAYVSAMLAVLKSMYRTENVVADVLPFTRDIGELGRDDWFGYGLIEPLQALEVLRGPVHETKLITNPKKGWTITFSKPILMGQNLQQHVQIVNAFGETQPVAMTIGENQQQLFVEPVENLEVGTYWLTVNQSLQSLQEDQLKQAAYIKFQLTEPSEQN